MRRTDRPVALRGAVAAALVLTLVSVSARPAGAAPAGDGPLLDVPFLPQTEALCGGAAAAMLFRYWGDTHADVQQFAPLVDRRAGGILDTALVDAIAARGWITERLSGTTDLVKTRLAAGQPLMLLLEDRPRRYHFVVAVGADDDGVLVHDPAWGPSRRLTNAELDRKWKPSAYWTLLVLPGAGAPQARAPAATAAAPPPRDAASSSRCDLLMEAALDDIAAHGLGAAEHALDAVRAQCPSSSAPVSELAGIRFAQRRTVDAAALAAQAIGMNPSDRYAWDVLGSSRFVLDDVHGALRAWERIGRPTVNIVRIEGLAHTRYALLTEILGLEANTALTDRAFTLAERRLQQLPDRLSARLGLRPEADGFATVDVAIAERPMRPHGPVEWAAAATRAIVDREVSVDLPGRSGQGEVWSAAWRWWQNRPRAAFSLAAPRAGRLPGLWRLDAAWDAQTYAATTLPHAVREERAHGGLTIADWLAPNLRYELTGSLDSWNGARRAASLGGAVELRLLRDRLATGASGSNWWPIRGGSGFRTASAFAAFSSSTEPVARVAAIRAGVEAASAGAPLALWSGAGEGRARQPLLRAHPLLDDGIVTGPVFGRRVEYVSAELQQWFRRPSLVRAGVAAFADAARARDRLTSSGGADQIDVGGGVRLRVPGREGTLRLDYAHGIRDGANAISVAWQVR